MIPNFLVIGAMKSGTDSLYQYLRRHPQVFMSEVKELDYFVEERNWGKGREWYERQFELAGDAPAVGEASTSYSKYPTHAGVPKRIAALLPNVRLIYLIRHPIDRMCSQYLHGVLTGSEREPIDKAFLTKPEYLDYSRYGLQISRYTKYFPAERLLVITSESLRHSRGDTLRRVFSFLGVDASWAGHASIREYHRTEEKRVARSLLGRLQRWRPYRALSRAVPMSIKDRARPLLTRGIDPRTVSLPDALRRELEEVLRDDVASLRDFVGPDFDGWGMAEAGRKVSS